MKGRVEPSLPSARPPLAAESGMLCSVCTPPRWNFPSRLLCARNSVESIPQRQDTASLTAFRTEHHVRHSCCHSLSFGKPMCESVCQVVQRGLGTEAECDERRAITASVVDSRVLPPSAGTALVMRPCLFIEQALVAWIASTTSR